MRRDVDTDILKLEILYLDQNHNCAVFVKCQVEDYLFSEQVDNWNKLSVLLAEIRLHHF